MLDAAGCAGLLTQTVPVSPNILVEKQLQFCIQFSHSLLSEFILGNLVIQQAPGLAAGEKLNSLNQLNQDQQ